MSNNGVTFGAWAVLLHFVVKLWRERPNIRGEKRTRDVNGVGNSLVDQ